MRLNWVFEYDEDSVTELTHDHLDDVGLAKVDLFLLNFFQSWYVKYWEVSRLRDQEQFLRRCVEGNRVDDVVIVGR